MKKVALATAFAFAATSAFAGNIEEPILEPEIVVVEEETASSGGSLLVPILFLIVAAAAAS